MNCPLDIIADNLQPCSPVQRAKQAAAIMAALAQDGFEITRADPQPERERIVQLLISADLAADFTFHFPRRYLGASCGRDHQGESKLTFRDAMLVGLGVMALGLIVSLLYLIWLPSWFAFKILATMLVLIVVACVFVEEDERGSYNA